MALNKGYVILAVNTDTVDYVGCAAKLAESLHAWMPTSKVCLVTDKPTKSKSFDFGETLPRGDLGGYQNDWQLFQVSPFTHTIKLEADMLCVSDISHWWSALQHRDMAVALGCRDHFDTYKLGSRYRKVFAENNLPDVYNAVTYWRHNQLANNFFRTVRHIFENWSAYRGQLRFCSEDEPSTDVVYALACLIIGVETTTMPWAEWFTMVHMKPDILGIPQQDWRDGLVAEQSNLGLRLDTIQQWGLVHYQQKDWL